MLLNEFYIGNNKYTDMLEDAIGKYRKAFMGKTNLRSAFVNTSAEADYLNRVIEKIFGYNAFNVLVEITNSLNACTITTVYRSSKLNKDIRKYIKFDSDRIYFDKILNMDTICIFYSSLIFNPEFTDREITGILLHEIGHNFEGTMNDPLGLNTTLSNLKLTCIPFKVLQNVNKNASDEEIIENCKNEFIDYIKYEAETDPGCIENFGNSIEDISTDAISNGRRIQQILASIRNSKVRKILFGWSDESKKKKRKTDNKYIGYGKEVLADEFASIFGYGVDLQSGLAKLGDVYLKRKKDIPIIGLLTDLFTVPFLILLYSTDEHPIDTIRIKKELEYLERELLNKDLSPKMRKDIQNQIDQLNEILDDALKLNFDDLRYSNIFTKLLKSMMYCLCSFNGRYISTEDIEEEFDNLKREYEEEQNGN